jgi:purine-binding chemotaxis protein CheW
MGTSMARTSRVAAAPEQRQFLTFTLGDRLLALPIDHVREIIEFEGMTEVPMMPRFLRGVINVRGAVVPVIDLQSRFGRGDTQIGRRTCVVIAEVPRGGEMQLLGTIVDSVNEVLTVETSKIEPKPGFGTGLRQDFVQGILNLEGRFVILLDISSALSAEEMSDLAAVSEIEPGMAHAGK